MPPTSETMEVNVEPSPNYFTMSIYLSVIEFSFHSRVICFKNSPWIAYTLIGVSSCSRVENQFDYDPWQAQYVAKEESTDKYHPSLNDLHACCVFCP